MTQLIIQGSVSTDLSFPAREISIPPSKSHTLRAIYFAAMADGESHLFNYLHSPDTKAMIEAFRLLGVSITVSEECLIIKGCAGKLSPAEDVIFSGNSGLVLRFISALSLITPFPMVITGDHSIRHQRPMGPLISSLKDLGISVTTLRGDSYAPLILKGPLPEQDLHKTSVVGQDSQFVSALLMAMAHQQTPFELIVHDPGEKPWVDLTLSWFKRLGISYKRKDYDWYRLEGNTPPYKGFHYQIPGDLSSLAFPLVHALLSQQEITLKNVDLSDAQGDKELIDVLRQMGAKLLYDQEKKRLSVKRGEALRGGVFDINRFIDALPILSVVALFATTPTTITGAKIARSKECDRLSCMALELKKLGANIVEHDDGMTITPAPLHGATLFSHFDHRLVMALSVAALNISGESRVIESDCVAKTYPTFVEDMIHLSANISIKESE